MATGLKYWTIAILSGFAILGVWLLPPEPLVPRGADVKPAEAMRFEEVNSEFTLTAETLRRVTWSDSLSQLSIRAARDGVALLVPDAEPANAEQIERFREKIQGELQAMPTRDASMLFSYAFQPHDQGKTEDMGAAARHRAETYVGQRDGTPYCLQVRVFPSAFSDGVLARELVGSERGTVHKSGVLGGCRPYLSHGLPGSTIQEWLERGGIVFAVETGNSEWEPGLINGRRFVLGFRALVGTRTPIEVDQCLAGINPSCAAIFRHPASVDRVLASSQEVVRRSPATSIGTGGLLSQIFFDQGYVLADLEAEFGSDAFAEFWTSEADVESAFEAAFRVDAGSWFGGWAGRTLDIQPPGPGLPRSASSGSMLAIALLLGVAFLRSRQRRLS